MNDFGFPEKLVKLTRICMEETKYGVKVDNEKSWPFSVDTGLKQGDPLYPVIFNIALKKMVRRLQVSKEVKWYPNKPNQNKDSGICR